MNTPSTTPVTNMDVNLTLKEVFTSNTFTYTFPNDVGFDNFVSMLNVKIQGDFYMSNYELVDANYQLYNTGYRGRSEEAPAISNYDLYVQFINHTDSSRDLALYIRSSPNQNASENQTMDTVRDTHTINVNEEMPILFPPVTPDQQTHAMQFYGIPINTENRYSDNRNNILWDHPLRTGTLYSNICEVCNESYPSRNYFGCRHTICENCIDAIQANNHRHCVYCNGCRI
jgi:hypothetical protein